MPVVSQKFNDVVDIEQTVKPKQQLFNPINLNRYSGPIIQMIKTINKWWRNYSLKDDEIDKII